jgi:LysR family glycine cleavage system transcriptional activator
MLPDLESLRCFEAAARLLSFRSAAAQVALSPAAFGERMRRLEDQLDAPLFVRTTRKVALTSAGQRLLPQARRALDEARRCRDAVHADGAPAPFELVIGTRSELGLSWLVPALAPLARVRPARRLHLHFGDSPELLERARRGHVDAALSSTRFAAADLEFEPLHAETYVFVAAPGLLARARLRAPRDAPGHTLLDVAADLPLFRYLLEAWKQAEPWRFARVEHLGTIAAIRARALEGAGVAVLPRYFVASDLRAGRLRQLLPGVRMASDQFRLIWRSGHPLTDELRRLAGELRARPLR